jgi:hypothetical protein
VLHVTNRRGQILYEDDICWHSQSLFHSLKQLWRQNNQCSHGNFVYRKQTFNLNIQKFEKSTLESRAIAAFLTIALKIISIKYRNTFVTYLIKKKIHTTVICYCTFHI